MTTATPLSAATAGEFVEEILGIAEDGAAVVLVSGDGGRSQVYQYRRGDQLVAEAPNLRVLAELIARSG